MAYAPPAPPAQPAPPVRLVRASPEHEAEEERLWDAANGGVPQPEMVIELHLSPTTSLPSYDLSAFTALRVLEAPVQIQFPNAVLPPSLTSLTLDRTPIRDLGFVRPLSALRSLSLSGTRVDSFADLAPLVALPALRRLTFQPLPAGDAFAYAGGLGSAPICATPAYRAYVLRTLPRLEVLDGVVVDRTRVAAEFAEHFQTCPSDWPRPAAPAPAPRPALPFLLASRAAGGSCAAFRRCASALKASEARVGEVRPSHTTPPAPLVLCIVRIMLQSLAATAFRALTHSGRVPCVSCASQTPRPPARRSRVNSSTTRCSPTASSSAPPTATSAC